MIESWFEQDLKNAVQVRTINGNVFSMDNNGNKVGVRVTNGGAPVTISGSISANVIRADGATVAVAGTASGNEAYVVMPQACYAVPGVITIIIKNTIGSDVVTLCAVIANVYQSSTDTAVDPGTIIPSVSGLIAAIESAVASIPEDYSGLSTNFDNARVYDLSASEIDYDFALLGGTDIKSYDTGAINPAVIGSGISFGSQANIRHFYIEVNSGDMIRAKLRKPNYVDGTACVVFTDDNDVVVAYCEIVNGVMSVVKNMYGVPDGATRMYIMTQDISGTNTVNTSVEKAYPNGSTAKNNIAGSIMAGYWSDASLENRGGTSGKYRSVKQYLDAGEYTVTFGADVAIIRVCIDGTYCDQSINIAAGERYSFRCLKNGNTGISFVQLSGGSEVTWDSWVQIEKSGVTLGKHSTTAVDYELRKKEQNGEKQLTAKTIGKGDLLNGYWNGSTYTKSNTRLTTFNFVPVKKGDIAVILDKELAIAFAVFDENRSNVLTSAYVSPGYYASNAVEAEAYQFTVDGYVSFNAFNREEGSSASISRDDYGDVVCFISMANEVEKYADYTSRAMMGNMRAKKRNATIQGQDGCIIGGKLYSFADGASSPGTISIIDIATMTNETPGSHQLGHANSVDYDEATDTLITFGFDTYPTIVLYQNPAFSGTLRLTDAGCVVIPLHNSGGTLNESASVCFGEAPNIAYFMEGVYMAGTTLNPERKIHKILLGMGTNNLSSEGYGTYISGKADNEYNGTCKIIKTYTGEIVPGVHCFANGNSLWTCQGMKFNGYLFVSYGTAGNNNMKIALNDAADTYRVVNNLHFEVLEPDGDVVPCEPEMLAIGNGKMYCGVTDRDTHDNYLYEIEIV